MRVKSVTLNEAQLNAYYTFFDTAYTITNPVLLQALKTLAASLEAIEKKEPKPKPGQEETNEEHTELPGDVP